jgi:hypothetical protein
LLHAEKLKKRGNMLLELANLTQRYSTTKMYLSKATEMGKQKL